MRISDWSSDVCSSDLPQVRSQVRQAQPPLASHPFVGDGAPLPGWPARLTVALGALVVLLVSALWPYVGTLVLVALMVLGRVTFRVRRRLYERRSGERRVGKECVRTFRFRWLPD